MVFEGKGGVVMRKEVLLGDRKSMGIRGGCIGGEKKKVRGEREGFCWVWYLEVRNFEEVVRCEWVWWIVFVLR